ncbi:hypothetical protein QBC38DRAFT_518515 [Podospora fimiseda]|uniref:Mid2 domain-containing protein n=1 Tax=Podospora fimiseda TaxID=252190 RepID=A0AAN7BG09_9PEZI|nr:hypothetical protein QBC38DRAFT_518515 [Podospora fimiseda]
MKALSLSSITTLLFLAQPCLAAKRCYYPGGKEAFDQPCDPDAEVSVCCAGDGLNHRCLSNGLCAGTNQIARGSCTDQSWKSTECAQVCLSNPTFLNRGSDLVSCRNVTGQNTDSYCCLPNQSGQCCDEGIGRFKILDSAPEIFATFNSAAGQFIKLKTDAPSPTLSPSTVATTSSSTKPTSTPTSPTSEGSEQQEQPDTDKQKDNKPSSGLSKGATAGIAVGTAIGALLIAAVILLMRKLKKMKDMQAVPQHPPDPSWGYPTSVTTPATHMYAGHSPVPSYPGYDQHQAKIVQPPLYGGELPTDRAPQELPSNHHY